MWELQANLIPKFGYCSQKFDDVAFGKSLVQGQLAINFVTSGYLIGALYGLKAANTGSATASSSSATASAQQQMQQLLGYQAMLQGPLGNALTPTELQSRLAQIQQLKNNLAKQLGPSGIAAINSLNKQQAATSSTPGQAINNAVYHRGPFTLVIESTLGSNVQHRRINQAYFISNQGSLSTRATNPARGRGSRRQTRSTGGRSILGGGPRPGSKFPGRNIGTRPH